MKLDWKGDDVFARVAAAAALGIDRTMAQAADHAKRIHPWTSRSGFLESSIMVLGEATFAGTSVGGSWGSNANYSLYVEVGTSRVGPIAAARVQASAGMWTVPPPAPPSGVTVKQSFTILPPNENYGYRTLHAPSMGTGPLMRAMPYLRVAADMEYPLTALRIALAYKDEAMI